MDRNKEDIMIIYEIKKKDTRMEVDLREHESSILDAYDCYCPGVEVEVFQQYYTVDLDHIPKRLAQKIGEAIAKSGLGRYAMRYRYGVNKDKESVQLFHRKEIE